ncbi:MAG: tetratricopeptide repeat protein [Acidobacteria bacterium]|nr:tetratricopeptide repeat protein [Acidobacteriota bacterium]
MTRRALPAGLTALIWVLAAVAGGCVAHDETVSTLSGTRPRPGVEALRPVSLPDLSSLAESVQDQVRERYASLMRTTENGMPPDERGNAYGELGLVLMAAGYNDRAASCYLNAQALAPDAVRWPYYLGHLYKTQGEPAQAAESFERVLELRPTDLAALVWLGEMYLAEGRLEAAERVFAHALSLEPGSAAALSGVGRAALASQGYVRAAEYLERALSVEPRALTLHNTIAMAYQRLGDLDKAGAHLRQRGGGKPTLPDPLMRDYEQVLRSPTAFQLRGMRALEDGRVAAAAAAFRTGLELAPHAPALLHGLGEALARAGDTRGAVEQFEEALRWTPEFAKAHFGLGMMLNMDGRPDEAIERFSTALEHQPDYLEARLALAEVLRVTGRLLESLPHLEQIVTLEPGLAEPWIVHAMTLVRLERYQEARDRLNEARHVHPDRPELTDLLVRLLAAAPDDQVRDGRRALVLMQELLEAPQNFSMGEAMAMTLAELGRYDEAATWQRQAMATAQEVGRSDLAQRMAENLALYLQRRPCRTPLD